MAMVIEDFQDHHGLELDLDLHLSDSATTTTSPTTSNDQPCNWNEWSPVVDWEALFGQDRDDFRDLIESMMDDQDQQHGHVLSDHGPCNSASTGEFMPLEEEIITSGEDFKGLRLVHLLMAAAEALTSVNQSRELARVILVRLKELVSPNDGTNMERLAAYFTEALQTLLESSGNVSKHFVINHRDDFHQSDVIAAFQVLQDLSPYVKFGHFTANQAILEAVVDDRRIHIVDFDIMEGIQWASLMQALVSRKDGPPAHLRITALSRAGGARKSAWTVQETGRRLVAFAASIGQPFSFHQCRLDPDESFKPSALKLVRGEALIFNCMLHLPHFNYRAPDSVASFLSGAKSLNPRLVTLVEEETRPIRDLGFMNQFMDLLHHYSAIYDSLEAGFPLLDQARALVERVFLGPQIVGSLARIYRFRGNKEAYLWSEWLDSVGFKPKSISFANHCQAKLLLGLFNDGYRVEELGSNKLVLSWKSSRLLSASIWVSSTSSDI